MTNKTWMLSFMILGMTAAAAKAEMLTNRGRVQLLRDEAYEQNLRWEASADKTVTPAKVMRWLMGFRGQVVSAPSSTEIQPIFNTQNGRVRFVLAFAYKF